MAGPRYGRLRYDLTILGLGFADGDFIKLGETSDGDIVIIRQDGLSDTDASIYAPGSIAIDTTNGKIFVTDGSDAWQIVTS